MYIITFYSFKGGVGRTMALVNTGAELARRGRKVLLVDFDLEAPGLNTYRLLRPPKARPGLVEFVNQFRQTRRSPLVTDFIYQAGKDSKKISKNGGQLWVMPAGRGDANYQRMLNAINWRTLYEHEDGFLLFEDTRLQWEAELHPDYVLIDARTGHTDIEGICTRQLPNAVVLVFHPNAQNLVGLTQVCRDIRAEENGGLKKAIKLHFVACNVPDLDDEDRLLKRQLIRFKKKLGTSEPLEAPVPIIHRYESLEMLDQPIFVLDRPRARLAREYRALTWALRIENPEDREGALLFLREAHKKESKFLDLSTYELGRWSRWQGHVPVNVATRVNRMTSQFWNDGEVLAAVGKFLLLHKAPKMALRRFDRALQLNPDDGDCLLTRALCRRELGDEARAAADLIDFVHHHGQNPEKNETALLLLLDISLDAFLRTLDLPPVKVPISSGGDASTPGRAHDSRDGLWFLKTSLILLQQRRWEDTIRFLTDERIKGAVDSGARLIPTWRPLYLFHLAMAEWGQAVEQSDALARPRRESCLQAIAAYEAADSPPFWHPDWLKNRAPNTELDYDPYGDDPFQFLRFYCSWYQDLALLYWGVNDNQKATEALGRARDEVERLGEACHEGIEPAISSWTFQETTEPEYRHDCAEIERMIRGEAVRPAAFRPCLTELKQEPI